MKLKDWADSVDVKYLTAYRWFKAGILPVYAYQTDSGTIIVEDTDHSTFSENDESSNVMGLFLKKTVEFSKNNSTVEDFAAYVISNFSLSSKNRVDIPQYSKNKPKTEDVQKHFKQFAPKGDKPKLNMFITEPETLDDLLAKENDMTRSNELPIVEDSKNNEDLGSLELSYEKHLYNIVPTGLPDLGVDLHTEYKLSPIKSIDKKVVK